MNEKPWQHIRTTTDGKSRYYIFPEELEYAFARHNMEIPLPARIVMFAQNPTTAIPKRTRIFKVSDAASYAERLVFPMYPVDNWTYEQCVEILQDRSPLGKAVELQCVEKGFHCHGLWTMMSEGGDPTTMRPDEAYLWELWHLNKECDSDEDKMEYVRSVLDSTLGDLKLLALYNLTTGVK